MHQVKFLKSNWLLRIDVKYTHPNGCLKVVSSRMEIFDEISETGLLLSSIYKILEDDNKKTHEYVATIIYSCTHIIIIHLYTYIYVIHTHTHICIY